MPGGLEHRRMALMAGALLAIAACAMQVSAAEPFDRLLSADVVSFAAVRDYHGLAARLEGSPYRRLLDEPQFAAVLDQHLARNKGLLAELNTAAGLTRADLAALPWGEVAVAAFRIRSAGNEAVLKSPKLSALLLVDLGPNEAQAREDLERLRAAAAGREDISVTEEECEGRSVLHFARRQTTSAEVDEELRVCTADGILAVLGGSDRGPLEKHLRARGDHRAIEPLRESANYRAIMSRVSADADFVTYQQFEHRWRDLAEQGRMAESSGRPNPARSLEALGLTGLKAQGSGTRIDAEGVHNDLFFLAPEPRTGLLKAVDPPAGYEPDFPGFVGEDAGLYAGFYVDAPSVWDSTMLALEQTAPLVPLLVRQVLANPNAEFNFESEIVRGVDGRFFVYLPAGEASALDGEQRVVYGVGVEDPEEFQKSLERFAALLQVFLPVDATPFDGTQIYYCAKETILLGGKKTRTPSVAVALAGRRALFARRAETIKSVLDGAAPPKVRLTESEQFKRCLPHMLERPALLLYADHAKLGERLWAAMGRRTELPPYETVAPYLTVQATTARWERTGLLVHTWIAPPSSDAPEP